MNIRIEKNTRERREGFSQKEKIKGKEQVNVKMKIIKK
jgi:hypothetical protein